MFEFRLPLLLLASLLLLGSSACKKEDLDKEGLGYISGIPYYHFTEKDLLWLRGREGDEWKFENARGYQRTYQVSTMQDIQAEHRYIPPTGSFINSGKLLNYYDAARVYVTRTDSSRHSAGMLRFQRDAARLSNLNSGGSDPNTSWLFGSGEWYDFVGSGDFPGNWIACRGLKFPSGPQMDGPFTQLVVRGKLYDEVLVFTGTPQSLGCRSLPPSATQELYYDRQAGMARMVSTTGEIWDRIP
ncbi:hypothetical protein BEN47_07220 [Hymenobacter lapidarius]|uniref:Uncharacterized protein n=1 Tax=Hymenobacter lapidarius TaxID=1908237 RepID=A0A1G1TEW7_9BACT|nr:hypothetical protein [Hymenobacter lapidarius]OGX89421.1 hypothetical protein BEN47_07220 [Hymenobacter lapidarius]